MAILMGPYYQSHGYGSQAMRLGIALAASQLKAKAITVKVWSFNLRTRHMVEPLGFKEVSRSPHAPTRAVHGPARALQFARRVAEVEEHAVGEVADPGPVGVG